MGDVAGAVCAWVEVKREILSQVLLEDRVELAVMHGAAAVESVPTIVDVEVAGRDREVPAWVGALEGSRAPIEKLRRRELETPRDQLNLELYDGDRFLARLMMMTQGPSVRAQRRLARAARLFERALAIAERRVLEVAPSEAGHAILSAAGEVELADAPARSWLSIDRVRASLARAIERSPAQSTLCTAGVEAKLTALTGEQRVVHLVELRRAKPLKLSPEVLLSSTQHRVAEFAAAGSTVGEIARSLTIAPETVRSHLREVYRRLSVSNRVELARAMDGSWTLG